MSCRLARRSEPALAHWSSPRLPGKTLAALVLKTIKHLDQKTICLMGRCRLRDQRELVRSWHNLLRPAQAARSAGWVMVLARGPHLIPLGFESNSRSPPTTLSLQVTGAGEGKLRRRDPS
jgi:hypothetical protein